MALLRLLCFPSAAQLSSPKSLSHTSLQPTTTSFHTLSLSSSSISRHSHILQIKTRRQGNFVFHVSSTEEAQSTTTETLEVESPSTQIPVEEEEEDTSRTRIIAQNVPFDATADDLRPLFEKYGTVLKTEFYMFNQSKNRGLAFIEMSSHEEAVAAITGLQSYVLNERILRLDWANPKKKKNPPRKKTLPIHNLYVTNLSFKARPKDLKDLFNGDKGNVASAEVIFDGNRRSKGFGFVSYNTEEEADEALNAFQGKEILGRPIRIAKSKTLARLAKEAVEAENSAVESNTSSPEPEEVAEEV
jgi:polyadenylate-binding protein